MRNLKWLGFRVPLAIVNKAHQANQLYPFAISLIESVHTYERACDRIEERISMAMLVAGMRKEIQNIIAEVSLEGNRSTSNDASIIHIWHWMSLTRRH